MGKPMAAGLGASSASAMRQSPSSNGRCIGALVMDTDHRGLAFRRLPRRWQDRLRPRSIRPAGARRVKPRLNRVSIRTGQSVVAASLFEERIHVKLSDATERRVDHVLLGTGYRVDISRYAFSAPSCWLPCGGRMLPAPRCLIRSLGAWIAFSGRLCRLELWAADMGCGWR